jgi:plasmid stabilization system protein ParE
MARVAISIRAEQEASRAYAWISERNPVRAEHWFRALHAVLLSLRVFPERCPRAPEGKRFGKEIRQVMLGEYRVLFRIEEDRVLIIHVRHGAMAQLRRTDIDGDGP